MTLNDLREGEARFYDLNPLAPNDIPFYRSRLTGPDARVLELGCGTGRVLLPLAESCAFIHGVDHSAGMLAVCEEKVSDAGLDDTRVRLTLADVTAFDLNERFDLIIAPYRLVQHMDTDDLLESLFATVRRHLSPGGRCILNVFHPNDTPDGLRESFACDDEELTWEVKTSGGRVASHHKRVRAVGEYPILFVQLIYRQFVNDDLVDEAVVDISMRCFYPDEFVSYIEKAGFKVQNRWGGYEGEEYGTGGELVVEFGLEG